MANDYELIRDGIDQSVDVIESTTYVDSDIEQLVDEATEKLREAQRLAAERI